MTIQKKFSVVKKETKFSGKWLNFELISYKDSLGKIRHWENVSRTTATGAVVIIAEMSKTDRIILVRQFRAPLNNYIMEFPAGLVDEKESFETTAIRELKEETGFSGIVKKIYPPVFSSPGLTDESICMAIVEIDEDLEENKNPKPACEITEDIEVFLVKKQKLEEFLLAHSKQGDYIDAKLINFALGINVGAKNE